MPNPVVFFPGTLCDERVWMPAWRQLAIQDRRYVPLQWANTLDEMLSITQHTIAQQKVHLVGFSMGGYIASLAAIKWPQYIASLTLISFASQGLNDNEINQRKATISAIKSRRYQAMSDSRLSFFLSKPSSSDIKQTLRNQAAQTIREMEADLGSSVLKCHIESTTPRPSITKDLSRLTCPINVITGDDDPIIASAALKDMKTHITHAHFVNIAEAGHMLPLENSREIAQHITRNCCA